MSIAIIESKKVFKNNDIFLAHIGYKHYDLGIQIHSWGLRIMLVWWHLCIHLKK